MALLIYQVISRYTPCSLVLVRSCYALEVEGITSDRTSEIGHSVSDRTCEGMDIV